MKKKIAIAIMSAGCLMVPACMNEGVLGFGVNNVGLDVCVPGNGILKVCGDVNTPIDDLFGGE